MNDQADVIPRLGLSLAPSTQIPIPAVLELVRLAERAGYESVWIPETWGADAVTLLTLLARETSRIRLAAGVFNVYSRSAALIAQTSASLQFVTGGRFVLGLGSSGPGVIEGWHGIPFERPVARTRDYVRVIRKVIAGEQVQYTGDTFQVSGFRFSFPEVIQPPIYIAALGPRNLRLTAEVADGWLPIFAPLDTFPALLSSFRSSIVAAARNPSDVDVATYLPALVGDRGERLLQQQVAQYVGGMGAFYFKFLSNSAMRSRIGSIREAWESGDRREAVERVSHGVLEQCTLGATRDQALATLALYQSVGLQLPVVMIPRGASLQEASDTIEAIAPLALREDVGPP